MFKKIVISTLLSSAVLLAESGGSININEKDVEIEGILDSRNLAVMQTTSTIYQGDFNFLNADDTKLIGAGVVATNKVEGLIGVEMSFGAKAIWAEVGVDSNFAALPLMAQIRYTLPPLMYSIPPISFEAKGLYAPSALSYGNSEGYSEMRLSADIEMINNVKVYGGYRNIHTKYEGLSRDLFDTGYYAGLKITY